MEQPITPNDEIQRLTADIESLRRERDAYRDELIGLRTRAEETVSAQLRLLAAGLSKEIYEEFFSWLRRVGWLFAIVVTIATTGGLWTLSDIIGRGVNAAVEKREKDIDKLRESVIQAVVDFRTQAKNALQDIETTKKQVTEEGLQASIEIRSRVSSVAAGYVMSDSGTDVPTKDPTKITAGSSSVGVLPETEILTIPVVVHVIYRTDVENISEAQIRSQIEVLNKDFRAANEDISKVPKPFQPLVGDARIHFVLASTDPLGKPTNGITRTRTSRSSFQSGDDVNFRGKGGADAWSSENYLNIWVANLSGGLLGFSQFPGGPSATDGVVVSYLVFGNVGTVQPPFNKGRTTTSQIGRYLNVRHIWGDTSDCKGNDFVADTPRQARPNFGKPQFPHITCNNGPNGDMFMNFADYVDDDAMYMFTKGQVARMRETLAGPRKKLGRR